MKLQKAIIRLIFIPLGLLKGIIHMSNKGARDIQNKRKFSHAIIDNDCCFTDDATVGTNSHIFSNCIINHSKIGNYTYIGRNSLIQNTTIGNYCSIAHELNCGLGNHPLNLFSTSPLFYRKQNPLHVEVIKENYPIQEYKPISIGHDVWIGARVTIIDGVNIGNGAVIATGAVVTKDIPPYAIAAGVPAKIIKYRNINNQNSNLSQEWWNNTPQAILSAIKK